MEVLGLSYSVYNLPQLSERLSNSAIGSKVCIHVDSFFGQDFEVVFPRFRDVFRTQPKIYDEAVMRN